MSYSLNGFIIPISIITPNARQFVIFKVCFCPSSIFTDLWAIHIFTTHFYGCYRLNELINGRH